MIIVVLAVLCWSGAIDQNIVHFSPGALIRTPGKIVHSTSVTSCYIKAFSNSKQSGETSKEALARCEKEASQ
jgi:hypothetical protein